MSAIDKDESEKRARFLTCTEDTVEEMEKFFDNKEKEKEGKGSDENQKLNDKILTQNKRKRGRPRVKTSEKLVSKKTHENSTKKHGFVPRVAPRAPADEKSPPAKAKRTERLNIEEEFMENDDNDYEDENEDDEINEVFENDTIASDVEEIVPNKLCIDCDQMYCDEENNNKDKDKCRICKSYEHGCLKKNHHERSKGDTWLCIDCVELANMIEKVHPNLFPNLRKTLVKKGMKRKRENARKRENDNEEIKTSSKGKTDEAKTNINERRVSFRTTVKVFDTCLDDEDLESLEDGIWISDSVIALWLKYLQEEICDEDSKMLFIPPSVTQLLKEGFTDDFSLILEPLNIWQKKYVFLAVNNNTAKTKSGGQHWSLLMYTIKENMWYYYDSMNNLNLKEARYLVGRLQDYLRPGASPNITEAVCSQQNNNYDCGVYTMAYAHEIVNRLTENSQVSKEINRCIFDTNHPNLFRKKIRDMILYGVDNFKTKNQKDGDINKAKKEENTEKTKMTLKKAQVGKDGKVINENELRDPRKFPNLNKDKLCYFLTKGTCKYGAKGENHLGRCVKYHPDQCREYNMNGTMERGCQKGDKCEKWHPTYFCHVSIDSKVCKRVDCYFKHHRNCTLTKSDNNNNFLDTKNENRRPFPPLTQQYPVYNRWQQQQQHRPQTHYQQNHQQYHQRGKALNQQHQAIQSPQIPYDQLKQVIQTVILEMNTY